MLHIIAGKHRGRRIETAKSRRKPSNMRPTTGMARESIFNILSHGKFLREDGFSCLHEAVVLDLFCGSGALGLEAISRGAAKAIFMDINPEYLEIARANATHIGEAEHCVFLRNDSSAPPPAREPCDVIFLDPPYNSGLAPITLKHLTKGGWLKDGCVVVVEVSKQEDLPPLAGYTLLDTRKYGITKIYLLKWEQG